MTTFERLCICLIVLILAIEVTTLLDLNHIARRQDAYIERIENLEDSVGIDYER